MAIPVAVVKELLPAYETSMRQCERCPTRYLEVKRIGEEGYRLCCQCWWQLAEDTIVYGMDAYQRQGGVPESSPIGDEPKNNSIDPSGSTEAFERSAYQRQVDENKKHKWL